MMKIEKYFDESYQYVDLWAAGFVKAYSKDADGEAYSRQKNRLVEALSERFDVINRLRRAIGLKDMTVDQTYDYYVNNLPEYDERQGTIDLYSFDRKTEALAGKEQNFLSNQNAEAYLHIMGAPDYMIENSRVIQERLNHINRLLQQGGYNKISPQKTHEILTELLMAQDI